MPTQTTTTQNHELHHTSAHICAMTSGHSHTFHKVFCLLNATQDFPNAPKELVRSQKKANGEIS